MSAKPLTGPAKPAGIDELILPYVPANVRLEGRYRNTRITSDVFDIATRLEELDSPYPLAINVTEDMATGQAAFSIVEEMPHETRLVFRTHTLDGRVIEYVQYLLKVPFAQRYEKAVKLLDKWDEEDKDNEMSDLVERVGLPMLRDLRECGFLGEYGHGPGSDLRRSRKRFGRG